MDDRRRYERLRILGCAPCYSMELERGLVLRFSNLDEYVDADLAAQPNRGDVAPKANPCRACSAAVRLAEEHCSEGETSEYEARMDYLAVRAQHRSDCPNQERR